MPLSPYFLYETTLHAPDLPPEPALAIGPHVETDGGLAYLVLTAHAGPFPQTLPLGTLAETPFGFLWTIGAAPVVFQLMTRQRFDDYWRAALPGPFPPFATNEDLWRWFSERYGWGWPAAPPSAPPGAMHMPPPPGAHVPSPLPAAPERPVAPPLPPPAWIELSIGPALPDYTGDGSRFAPLPDSPPGLTVRWNGDRVLLFAQVIAALGHAYAELEGGYLPPVIPPSPPPVPGAAPVWLSARMGTRGNPDATTQFVTLPVSGFDPGLILTWPANVDGLVLSSQLTNALRVMDDEVRAEEPSAPPAPPSLTTATDAWADLVRRHRAEQDDALVAALSAHAAAGPSGAERLRTLGAQIAHMGHPGTASALIAWLHSAPDDARLAVVATVLDAAWTVESEPLPVSADAVAGLAQASAVASESETRAAVIAALETAMHAASADAATRERVRAAIDTLNRPIAAPASPASPPGSQPTEAIQIRQLPPSEDSGTEVDPLPPPEAPAPPSAAPPLVLIVEDGDAAGRRVALDGRILVGRHAACDLSLTDMEISRNHAVIERDDAGQTTIRDTNSANGVFVNGARVATHTLLPDDRLILGQTRLRVVAEGD